MLSGACGLAAAGRLRRGGRSLAATFVLGESAPLEGDVPPGPPRVRSRVAEPTLPRAARELPLRVVGPARARDAAGEGAPCGVQ